MAVNMYRCGFCQQVTPKGARQQLVYETRPAHYPYRWNAHPARGVPRHKWHDDPGGTGHETARAIPACAACAHSRPEPQPA